MQGSLLRSTFVAGIVLAWVSSLTAGNASAGDLSLVQTTSLDHRSPWTYATYLQDSDQRLYTGHLYSEDNGRTWTERVPSPDFDAQLPYGYRREPHPPFVDPTNGWILRVVASMDTPGLNPAEVEPAVSLETYYLRYRVSRDEGRTYLFDEQIIQAGHTPEIPFDGVVVGKNGIFLGDVGSIIIRTQQGEVLIPAQACTVGPDGKLYSPGGGFTYTDVIMVIGRWQADGRMDWTISQPIQADPARSTRGMIEPTIIELGDGRLLCIMRGSNGGTKDPDYQISSHKWKSVSADGGHSWTAPEPWTYDDGVAFHSPSAMSQLLKHSSGRVIWIGNICPENAHGNNPRWPLVIGEVDPQSLTLRRESVLEIDTKRADEPGINLSHWWGVENRKTRRILVAMQRFDIPYEHGQPVLHEISME